METCRFSHGWKEQQFHPLVYKTQPCNEQKCFKGFECPYYHSSRDYRRLPAVLTDFAPRDGSSQLNPEFAAMTLQQPQRKQSNCRDGSPPFCSMAAS